MENEICDEIKPSKNLKPTNERLIQQPALVGAHTITLTLLISQTVGLLDLDSELCVSVVLSGVTSSLKRLIYGDVPPHSTENETTRGKKHLTLSAKNSLCTFHSAIKVTLMLFSAVSFQ